MGRLEVVPVPGASVSSLVVQSDIDWTAPLETDEAHPRPVLVQAMTTGGYEAVLAEDESWGIMAGYLFQRNGRPVGAVPAWGVRNIATRRHD